MFVKGHGVFLIFFLVFLGLPHKSFEKTCYPQVGCFDVEDWLFPISFPPQHPALVATFMYFYNRNIPNGTIYKTYPYLQIEGIPYDPFKNTIMVCHGFIDNSEVKEVLMLKDAILNRLDVNLIIIDYSLGAAGIYFQTLGNLPVAARVFTSVVLKLGIPPSQLYLMGHSLGAHLAGQIANQIEEATGEKVYRISGLDPAGPWIAQAPLKFRLDRTDANFVDAIHSNYAAYGTINPVGHIDFYINGGALQPGCFIEKIEAHMDFKTFCAHQRGYEYFTDTLKHPGCMKGKPRNPDNFEAAQLNTLTHGKFAEQLSLVQGSCADNRCATVGLEAIESPLGGSFEVITKAEAPFCIPLP